MLFVFIAGDKDDARNVAVRIRRDSHNARRRREAPSKMCGSQVISLSLSVSHRVAWPAQPSARGSEGEGRGTVASEEEGEGSGGQEEGEGSGGHEEGERSGGQEEGEGSGEAMPACWSLSFLFSEARAMRAPSPSSMRERDASFCMERAGQQRKHHHVPLHQLMERALFFIHPATQKYFMRLPSSTTAQTPTQVSHARPSHLQRNVSAEHHHQPRVRAGVSPRAVRPEEGGPPAQD